MVYFFDRYLVLFAPVVTVSIAVSRLFALDERVMSVFIDFALITVEYFGPTMSWYSSINYSFIAIVEEEVACITF